MLQDMQKILSERLRHIDAEIARLRAEKVKTKQAIAIFKADTVVTVSSDVSSESPASGKEPTFKEKVKIAMQTQYPDGANAREILTYINSYWQRQVKRASLSPQLSRLRHEGVLTVDNGVWKLVSVSVPINANTEAPLTQHSTLSFPHPAKSVGPYRG